MLKSIQGQEKYNYLRKSYKQFIYKGFNSQITKDFVRVSYDFSIDEKIIFAPEFKIPITPLLVNFSEDEFIESDIIRNLLFNIGLIELISYWKAACPKEILIMPYKLTDEQIDWWKHLYFNGLGEFFYTNNIQENINDFVNIKCDENAPILKPYSYTTDNTIIVPVGGGKDSVVSLELIKTQYQIVPFIINPSKTTLACTEVAGFTNDSILSVLRTIHPTLLELNSKGFLNGHTPFSALLAFYSLLIAYLSGHKYIALSNESSANEPTVVGTNINHQYSKSFEFEDNFRQYASKYISPDMSYFSFLRPLNELQIAQQFAKFTNYHSVFRSCNAGSKENIWCCNCPKCLFAYIILSPFISSDKLKVIFGEDLFDKKSLLFIFKQLCGIEDVKPFECVGTISEVNAALHATISKYEGNLPFLLDFYKNTNQYKKYDLHHYAMLLNDFDMNNNLPEGLLNILRNR